MQKRIKGEQKQNTDKNSILKFIPRLYFTILLVFCRSLHVGEVLFVIALAWSETASSCCPVPVCDVPACSMQPIIHHTVSATWNSRIDAVCLRCEFSPAVTLCPVLALWGQRMLERACVTGQEHQEEGRATLDLLTAAKMAASLSLIQLAPTASGESDHTHLSKRIQLLAKVKNHQY